MKKKEVMSNTIRHDVFDKMIYQDIYSQSKDLQDMIEQGMKVVQTFSSLGEDVFFALYTTSPVLMEQTEMAPEAVFNYEQMAKILESPSYRSLRQYTQLDELGAGLGSKALLQALLQELENDTGLQEIVKKINEAVEQGKAGHSLDQIEQLMNRRQVALRQAVERAMEKGVREVEEVESLITSWGFEKGEFTRMPYDKKVELLQVLRSQHKFKKMSQLVGRMRTMAVASRKIKVEQNRIELHAITQGNDLQHVLPQELLALRRPVLKMDFYRRMMEKQLMQYDLHQRECKGQGPILALIDTSGSMRNDREIWSKSVALGLAEIAEKERRSFSYALFASDRDDLLSDEFQIGQHSPEKIMRLATDFIGGGTDYEQPLQWALTQLQESPYHKADIVMITDGECALSPEFLAKLLQVKGEKEFRIYSILIGSNPRHLQPWSDEIWCIDDLLDDTTVKELFNNM